MADPISKPAWIYTIGGTPEFWSFSEPLRGSDLGLGYELGLRVYCPVMPLPQSSLNPMCTYPDVLLYILLFPGFRVARILKRFVT